MTKLTFLGATGTVTGSRFLLEIVDKRFLIDCGLFQGKKENREKNRNPFPCPPPEVDRVFLTHAHIDHSGYLPRLGKYGFSGPIHATHATRDLCRIMLKDSAHLQEEDADWANQKGFSKHSPALPLYTMEDAEKVLTQFASVHYGEAYYPKDPDLQVKFKDAGHILGASFIEFKRGQNKESRKILFSGDFGRPSQVILKDPTQVFNVDYLILESTYGDRLHDEENPVEQLAAVITESYERGGVLVIPAFAVGRTQTLLYVIRELEEQGRIPEVEIFIDSPMAINVTDVFKNHLADFDIDARVEYLKGKKVFYPKNLHICRDREQSRKINDIQGGAIIISASGMVTGGRILHHLKNRLPEAKNTVLFIGYQAEGTRGKTILDGNKSVTIHGQDVPIQAQIKNINGFSGHGDYNEILAWLMGFNKPPKRTFIVHGEGDASRAMADKIRRQFGWDVIVPKFNDSFELEF